jgi:hypothetical protein
MELKMATTERIRVTKIGYLNATKAEIIEAIEDVVNELYDLKAGLIHEISENDSNYIQLERIIDSLQYFNSEDK